MIKVINSGSRNTERRISEVPKNVGEHSKMPKSVGEMH